MARPTTILALVQTLVVVAGFIGLGLELKHCGYPNGELMGVRWTPLAVFLREHLGWLMMVPLLWVIYASAAERRNLGWLSYRAALGAGLCIAVCVLAAFLVAIVHPYTWPLPIYIR